EASVHPPPPGGVAPETAAAASQLPPVKDHPASIGKDETPERVLRLTADNLNRLLGLAGESLVESRWLRPFAEALQRLKRMQIDLERTLDGLRQSFEGERLS